MADEQAAATTTELPDLEVESFQILSLDGEKAVMFKHRKMPFMRSQETLRYLLNGLVPGAKLPVAHEDPRKFCAALVMQLYPIPFDTALKTFFEFLVIKGDGDSGFGPLTGNEKKLDGIVEGVDVFLLVMHCVGYHFLASFRDRPSLGLSLLDAVAGDQTTT